MVCVDPAIGQVRKGSASIIAVNGGHGIVATVCLVIVDNVGDHAMPELSVL